MKKNFIKELFGWTLEDIDNADYYELCELFAPAKEEIMSLADFIRGNQLGSRG